MSKRRRQWDRLPLRRKLAYVGTAAIVVMGAALSAAYVVTHRPQPPQVKTVAFGSVARTGSVDVTRLTDLSTAGLSPKGQASQPVFPLHPGQGKSAADDHNTSLAPIAATIPDAIPDGAGRALVSKAGPEQGGVDPGGVGLSSPMDVSLAASDHYAVETVDGAIQVFGYNGQADGPELAAADLFAPVLQSGDLLGQLHVAFDEASQRWVIVADETNTDTSGVSRSYFDVAISQDVQPVTDWSLYQINTEEGGPAGCTWADDPRLGSDATAFYLTGNSYGCGGSASFRGAMLWALPKKTFFTGKATQYLRWSGLFTNTQHQPVFSLVPAMQSGNASTEWLMSDDAGYATGSKTSRQVFVYAVLHPEVMEVGQIPSLVGVYVGLQLPYADPPSAMQSGSPNAVMTGDARIASLVGAGGHLYAAFTTAVNWQGDKTTRSGIYWLDLVPQVVQGAVSGAASAPDTARLAVKVNQANIFGFAGGYTFYPALAADANGDVALLGEASSQGITPSLIVGWRHPGDSAGAMGTDGDTVWLHHGAADGPYTGAHWGDYSGAWLAPSAGSGRASVWLAGPYMTDYPTRWQTLVWQMPI